MTRMFLTGMMERKCGKIMSICSMGCVLPAPSLNVYCATKWGLNGFMLGLADELLVGDFDKHIKLTTVYPDIINTRKEAMDLIDKMKNFMPKLTPERVADEAVSGMLRRRSNVYVSNTTFLFFLMR
jgi:short-subunit dehydrogenase